MELSKQQVIDLIFKSIEIQKYDNARNILEDIIKQDIEKRKFDPNND